MAPALLAALVCLLVATVCQPVVIGVLRRSSVLDVPNARSSHVVPTPRGGGIALVAGMVVALAVTAPDGVAAPLVALTGFAAIGLVDDVRSLRVRTRLAAQLTVAATAAALVLGGTSGPGLLLALGGGLAAVWMCAFVNAFNFMDGINGISALHALVGGLALAGLGAGRDLPVLAVAGLATAAAGLAFLPWNALRARVFLGDVGSYGLGAVLGLLPVLAVLSGIAPEVAVAPLALYLADTGWTLLRRVRAGEDWSRPHRSHVYQRLCDLGWTHPQVAAATAVAAAAVTACAALALTGRWELRLLGDALALGLLAAYLASPRLLPARSLDHGVPV